MNFFKPSDFITQHDNPDYITRTNAAFVANAKLERDGKVVYSESPQQVLSGHYQPWHNISFQGQTHKAFLINIEPIAVCTHTKEKVKAQVVEGWDKTKNYSSISIENYICECGAKVKPSAFEEVK